MKILIFKTNIKTKKNVKALQSLFKYQSNIINWSIDLEDIDKVLKINAIETLDESDVRNLVKVRGFCCEPLTE